jgi:PAS domain S-box-containing protein
MTLLKPTDSAALIQSNKKNEALEQQARDLAQSVETVRQQTLFQTNERIETLEQKARDLADFVETTRQQILLQSDKKTEDLEQKARDLADFVESLRTQTRLQSEKEIEVLGQKARDLAYFVESVRKETRLQFETEIAAMRQKAQALAASVETVREMTLLQSDSQIAMLEQSREKTLAMNEALVLGSLRQHELTEAADTLNVQLQREITERKKVEAALRESEERYRYLFNSIDEGFCVIEKVEDGAGESSDFRYVEANPAFTAQSGISGMVGKTIGQMLPGESEGWCSIYDTVLRTGESTRFEHGLASYGRVLELYAFRVEDKTHRRVAVIFKDITERKQAEERKRFLLNELAHRGKNLLTVIQSITSRSLSGTRPLTEAREVLIQRLHALARSQTVLIREDFRGAPVAEIIRLEFEGFSNRVKAVGPDLMLNARVAQTFSLVVHELATNATKHGALSGPSGQVTIHWSIEDAGTEARFKFQWQELDGPPVVPPTRQGFGRIVLENAVAQDFGAPPKISFAPEGLNYEIDAPLSLVAVGSADEAIPFRSA